MVACKNAIPAWDFVARGLEINVEPRRPLLEPIIIHVVMCVGCLFFQLRIASKLGTSKLETLFNLRIARGGMKRVLRKALSNAYDLEEQVKGNDRQRNPSVARKKKKTARSSARHNDASTCIDRTRIYARTRTILAYSSLSIHPLPGHLHISYLSTVLPTAPDDKSDIATRDNFGALLPEKSNHIACQ